MSREVNEYFVHLLGSNLMIFFISSSNPISRIRSASSIIKHCRFLYIKLGVFCKKNKINRNKIFRVEKINIFRISYKTLSKDIWQEDLKNDPFPQIWPNLRIYFRNLSRPGEMEYIVYVINSMSEEYSLHFIPLSLEHYQNISLFLDFLPNVEIWELLLLFISKVI